MPAAAPVPRGPSVTTLYSAADLLTGPGCPVCRYAGEASDRYLAWFAVEAHAQAVTVTRLRASLGMCPRHPRALMSQPGAAARLTAVYRYLIEAAQGYLNGQAPRLRACPACEHDDGAAGRALDTLLEGLTDDRVRERYRELGGLCIPHLRSAAARGDRRTAAWLSGTLQATLCGQPASSGWLTGTDYDADMRAVLRQVIPAGAHRDFPACLACLRAGRSESDQLAWMLRAGEAGRPDRGLLLCAAHLNDLAILAGRRGVLPLLAWQAGCLAAAHPPGLSAAPPRWQPGSPASWLRPFRRAASLGSCPVCLRDDAAAGQALDDIRALLHGAPPAPGHPLALCVRHLLALRAADPRAGQVAARGGADRAEILITELHEAFRKSMWVHRGEASGAEMTAWRRAAAFLDGGVFCGGPPRET